MDSIVVRGRIVVSVLAALVCAVDAQAPTKNSIAGIWLAIENVKDARPATLDLQAGGAALWMTKDAIKEGTWTLEGNLVSLSFEKGTLVYDGRLKGGKLVGAAQKDTAAWTWEASREDAIVSATPARPAPGRPPEPGRPGRVTPPPFVLQSRSFDSFAENYQFLTKLFGERPEAPFIPPLFPYPLNGIDRAKPMVLYPVDDPQASFVLVLPIADEQAVLKQLNNPQLKDGVYEMPKGNGLLKKGDRGLFMRIVGGEPRGFLGVQMSAVAGPRGVVVVSVPENSPAAKAGILKGDVLVAIDGQKARSPDDVRAVVTKLPGRAVAVLVIRDGTERTLQTTIGAPPHVADRYAYFSASLVDDEQARRALDRVPDAMDILRLGETADFAVQFTPSYLSADTRRRIGDKFNEFIAEGRRRANDVPAPAQQALFAVMKDVERWGHMFGGDVDETRLSLDVDRAKNELRVDLGVFGRRGSEFSTAVKALDERGGVPEVAGAAASVRISLPLSDGLQKLAAAVDEQVRPNTPFERQISSSILDALKWGECQLSLGFFGPSDKGKAAMLIGVKNVVANPGKLPPPLAIHKLETPLNDDALKLFGETTTVATIRPGVSWIAIGDGAAATLNKALLAPPAAAGPVVFEVVVVWSKLAEFVGDDVQKQALRNAFPNGGDRVRFAVGGGNSLRGRLTVPIELVRTLRDAKAQNAP